MTESAHVDLALLRDSPVWKRIDGHRVPIIFDLEATARCPNDCRHCYINRPAVDPEAQSKELSPAEIADLGSQAVRLGAMFCTLTGGDPLLRADFPELYLALKRCGLLVSVYTSATLISKEHVALFQKYPPRDVEVTVYGATEQTYESIARRPGSYGAFRRGLELLRAGGIPVRLKAMALRSNIHEFQEIAEFGRAGTRDFFRFDTLLHLRLDRDDARNFEIKSERLSAAETVALEYADQNRSRAMKHNYSEFIHPRSATAADRLLYCGAGIARFCIAWDGMFELCSSFRHLECMYNLRSGTLEEAWNHFTPAVLGMGASDSEFRARCGTCPIVNLCLWCPAHAYLETGSLERHVPEFCAVAHARATALQAAVAESHAATGGHE